MLKSKEKKKKRNMNYNRIKFVIVYSASLKRWPIYAYNRLYCVVEERVNCKVHGSVQFEGVGGVQRSCSYFRFPRCRTKS